MNGIQEEIYVKKILLAAMALALCLSLSACANVNVDEAYQTALELTDVPSAVKPEPEPEPETEPEAKPEPEPAVSDLQVWPEGVPALGGGQSVTAQPWRNDGSFEGRYLVTSAQLDDWLKRMAEAGFVSSPSTAAGWTVSWVSTAQQGKADYLLRITAVKSAVTTSDPGLYEGFEQFPAFTGVGSVTYTPATGASGAKQLILTSSGETADGLGSYTDALKAAGFMLDDGAYKKTVDGMVCVASEGMWTDSDTLHMTFDIHAA